MAKHLGINSSYITGHHCYVLVRVSRYRHIRRMNPVDSDVLVDDDASLGADSVKIGDEPSVYSFLRNYGSHYVVGYTTGNALYQVRTFSLLTSCLMTTPSLVWIPSNLATNCPLVS